MKNNPYTTLMGVSLLALVAIGWYFRIETNDIVLVLGALAGAGLIAAKDGQ